MTTRKDSFKLTDLGRSMCAVAPRASTRNQAKLAAWVPGAASSHLAPLSVFPCQRLLPPPTSGDRAVCCPA